MSRPAILRQSFIVSVSVLRNKAFVVGFSVFCFCCLFRHNDITKNMLDEGVEKLRPVLRHFVFNS